MIMMMMMMMILSVNKNMTEDVLKSSVKVVSWTDVLSLPYAYAILNAWDKSHCLSRNTSGVY